MKSFTINPDLKHAPIPKLGWEPAHDEEGRLYSPRLRELFAPLKAQTGAR